MNKLSFLFLILVVAVNLEAKELWIQAVGIDTKVASQNFDEHYYEGRSFAQLCKTKPSRQCEQFINLDPKLAASEGGAFALSQIVQGHTIKNLKGPTKGEILARLEAALKNAGPGDKIIFSLVNHGGPSREEKKETGKSCISIDGDDCISELDLANIIKRHPLPERANLGIVVSACYSGAFHDLMAENVCVASTSDQYFASNSDTSDLWTSAVVRKAKSFSELTNPLNSHQNRIRLSAQIKNERDCSEARQKMSEDDVQSLRFYLGAISDSLNSVVVNCQSPRNDIVARIREFATTLNSSVFLAAKNEFLHSCKSVTSKFNNCDELENLPSQLAKEVSSLANLKLVVELNKSYEDGYSIAKEIDELDLKIQEGIDFFQESSTNPKAIPPKSFVSLGREDKALAEKYWRLLESSKSKISREQKQVSEKLQNDLLLMTPLFEKFRFYQDCFLDNRPRGEDETALMFNRIAQSKPKLKFTKKEVEQTQKCEQNLSF